MIINPTGALTEEKASYTAEETTVSPGYSSTTLKPTASDGLLTKVTVEGDSNLVASNIKKGVTIFGVTGTYSATTTTTYYMPIVSFAGSASQPNFCMTAGTDVTIYANDTTQKFYRVTQKANDGFSSWSVTRDSSGAVVSWKNVSESKCTLNHTEWSQDSGYDYDTSWLGGYCIMPYSVTVTSTNFWNYTPVNWPRGTYKVRITNFHFSGGWKMCWFPGTGSSKSFSDSYYDNATLVVSDSGATLTWTVPASWVGWKTLIQGWHGVDDYVSVYGESYVSTMYAQVTKIISYTPA